MAMDGDIVIGGITFNKNDVKRSTERTVEGSRNGEFKQSTQYEVELSDGKNGKDGTIIIFGEQDKRLKPKVELSSTGAINFYGLRNAEIIDTENDDIYNLVGCQFTNVKADRTKEIETGGGCSRKRVKTVSLDKDKITGYERAYDPDISYVDRQSKDNSAKLNYFGNDSAQGPGIISN